MVVNINVALSDEVHELLERLKKEKSLKNNAEAIEWAIKTVTAEVLKG